MNGRVWPRIVLAELGILAIIALGVVMLVRGARGADPVDRASGEASMSLADVPDDIASHYRYAADHPSEFAAVPCYCGCDRMLAHRHLGDCFVNSDGSWDPHASACSVCIDEAVMMRARLDAGTSIDLVRDSIIETFGPPPNVVSAGAQP